MKLFKKNKFKKRREKITGIQTRYYIDREVKVYKLEFSGACCKCGKEGRLYSTIKGGGDSSTSETANWEKRNLCKECITREIEREVTIGNEVNIYKVKIIE